MVDLPEGPIRIRRWNPNKGETLSGAKSVTISSQMLWRLANSLVANQPINVDRIFGASYNTRSVLESLLAHTPQFYYCYPGRIESINSKTRVKSGHKHLMWKPEDPHLPGLPAKTETDVTISEIPAMEAYYEGLVLPDAFSEIGLDIEVQRRHAQIQIALYFIGKQLGFKTWIAQNDRGILYQNKRLAEFEGIISSLKQEKLMTAYDDAVQAALRIDCIWFKNGRLMPAVMEVEHSTGVTSGLARMKNFKDKFPPFLTRYVIVASDDDRRKVVQEANKAQFLDLDVRFFPYSAVEELYALCQKRKLRGITEDFLDCYMEKVKIA